MSSFHDALYVTRPKSRQQVFAQLDPVLDRHGVRFLNTANGFWWDREENEFVPDHEQDLELTTLSEAVAATADWTCVHFDLRLMQWAFGLSLYDTPTPATAGTNVLLNFPDSLYKFAVQDPVCAARWLGLLAHTGLALDRAAMICGLEVEMISASEDQLLARFQQFLQEAAPGSYAIHTLLTASPLLAGPLKEKVVARGFSALSLAGPYQLWTQLRYDGAMLLRAITTAEPALTPECP
jgi:hypothetical protein